MKVGTAFVSPGGQKLARAIRSFRRAEPDLPIHILLDVRSEGWKRDHDNPSVDELLSHPNVFVRPYDGNGYINGAFNAAIRWMSELGYSHACLLQDDTVYSSLPENRGHISDWFLRTESNPQLYNACALSLSFIEAIVPTADPGCWHWPPERWAQEDLESESFWRQLLPGGNPRGYADVDDIVGGEVRMPGWFARYCGVRKVEPHTRLGPVGYIIPVATWESVGGFDEYWGVFFDTDYPANCGLRGLPQLLILPNVPFLHLHCQSTWSGDPAVGVWGDTMSAFERKYNGTLGDVLRKCGYLL